MFLGMVGGRMAEIKWLASNSFFDMFMALAESPMMIGMIWVVVLPMFRPISVNCFRNILLT